MKKFILIIYFISYTAIASVHLVVEPQDVATGQVVKITITIKGSQSVDLPDLAPLSKDFRIVGTQRSLSYTVINGKATFLNQFIIELLPKQEGKLVVPALTIGNEQTTAQTITVKAGVTSNTNGAKPKKVSGAKTSSAFVAQDESDIKLEAAADVLSPYINQQVIYTTRLYHNQSLFDAQYQPPQVKDALMITLGPASQYQIFKDGELYNVEEQRYAIFPQKSGKLKITPPVFKGYSFHQGRMIAQAKSTILQVQPALSMDGDLWLPAKSLKLTENYEDGKKDFAVGDTITRTVTIKVEGFPAELLPTLNFNNTNEVKSYPQAPVNQNSIKNGEIFANSTIKIGYLLNKEGDITIPAIKINWFNTIKGKKELASLPALKLKISKVVAKESAKNNVSSTEQQILAKQLQQNILLSQVKQDKLGWLISIIFIGVWLFTLLLWWGQYSRRQKSLSINKIIKKIKISCLHNDFNGTKDALLEWSNLRNNRALTLEDLQKSLPEHSLLFEQINILSKVIYSNQNYNWQGKYFWQAFNEYRKIKEVKLKKDKKSLPAINF